MRCLFLLRKVNFGMKHKLQAVRENKSLEFVPSAITNLRLVSPRNIYARK